MLKISKTFLVLSLFLSINSTLYITMEIEEIDDCVDQIYKNKNGTNIIFFKNNNGTCEARTYDMYPSPLISNIPYEYGEKLYFDLIDIGGEYEIAGYLVITVYVNEFIIRTNHTKFWKCTNCEGENGNYIYNTVNNRFDFFNQYHPNNIRDRKTYYFYFQINSASEFNYKGNEIIDYYYSLSSKKYFFNTRYNLQEELDLINFNTSDNFYIIKNNAFTTPFEDILFKIFFDETILFSGNFIGLDSNHNDKPLNNQDTFYVSNGKGLRYKLSDEEKQHNNIYLKIYLQSIRIQFNNTIRNTSQIEEFNFYICKEGYKQCDIEESFKCLNEGYYYDSEKNRYFSCYESCGSCNKYKRPINSNYSKHFCDECGTKYPYYIIINEIDEIGNNLTYKNCYKVSPVEYNSSSISIIEEQICEEFLNLECIKCPENYPYLLREKNGCYDKCNILHFFNKICEIKNNKAYIIDNYIKIIQNELLDRNISLQLINEFYKKNENLFISYENINFEITSMHNHKNSKTSTINLDMCEKKLVEYHRIANDSELIIFKIEVFEKGLLIPIIEYEVYDLKNNIKLDLNICNDTYISISIPVIIEDDNLFKYDPYSDYYNDICFPYTTTQYKTDIILKDRRNEFLNKNLSLCEKNCEYKGYNISTKEVLCNCKTKLNFSTFSEIISDKDKLFNSFLNMKNNSNLWVIKCYYILFTKKGILYNIGSYILLFIIIIHIISLILFILKGFKKLNLIITGIISLKNKDLKNNNMTIKKSRKRKKTNNINNPPFKKHKIKKKIKKLK